MSGSAVIWQLLKGNAAMTALVPQARIVGGVLPLKTVLPAISVIEISSVDVNIPSPGASRRVSDRVQVTVAAPDFPTLRAVMRAVKKAAADKMPAVNGVSQVNVITDGKGPDMMDDAAQFYMRTQDFIVGYNEPT